MAFPALFGRRPPPAALPETIDIAGRRLAVVAERRSTARAVKLRADSVRGVIRLTLPPRAAVQPALRLLADHHDWLAAQVAAWPQPLPFEPGAVIPFDGGDVRLDWHPDHPRQPLLYGAVLRLGGPRASIAGRTRRWLCAAALTDLSAATHALAAAVGRPVTAVRVGDPRCRWGSCASGGRIAYSWRLMLAPRFVRHAVVAHEVAHLVHPNHGPDFHALVARLDDNAVRSRRWLTRHGAALHWVGRPG